MVLDMVHDTVNVEEPSMAGTKKVCCGREIICSQIVAFGIPVKNMVFITGGIWQPVQKKLFS